MTLGVKLKISQLVFFDIAPEESLNYFIRPNTEHFSFMTIIDPLIKIVCFFLNFDSHVPPLLGGSFPLNTIYIFSVEGTYFTRPSYLIVQCSKINKYKYTEECTHFIDGTNLLIYIEMV